MVVLATSFSCCLPLATFAQTIGHYNKLDISLVDSKSIECEFSLNLLPLLQSYLAPKSDYGDFLQSFSKLSDSSMQKELDKLTKELAVKSFFNLPSGAKLSVTHWQLPSKQLIREAIKVNLMMLQMPPNAASHIDPMLIQAKASSKMPVTRVKLQLHPALFPIFVSYKEDKFWLTQEIPVAILDIY